MKKPSHIPYFLEKTSRLPFISALPQCGDYSRAATIRGTDVAATIYFSATAMRRLFEGGYYLKYRRRGYYLFQLYRNAATIRGRLLFEVQTLRLLFISALPQCGVYSRAATIRGVAFIRGNTVYTIVVALRYTTEFGLQMYKDLKLRGSSKFAIVIIYTVGKFYFILFFYFLARLNTESDAEINCFYRPLSP